jgi:hypothetical protein
LAPLDAFGFVRGKALLLGIAVGAWPCLGCQPKTDGLADLVDGGYSYVEFPGRRLLKGNVTSYGLDFDVAGAVAVGLRDGRLVMAAAGGGPECDAGDATDFVLAGYYGIGVDYRSYVPFLESKDEQGRGPLRFADHQCASPLESPVPDSELPFYTGLAAELPRYLMLGVEGDEPFRDFRSLVECWLWSEPVSCKTSSVKQLTRQPERLWSIELDPENATPGSSQPTKLVAHDGLSSVSVEYAREVSEVAATELDVAFIDASGLNLFDDQRYASLQQIEPDACSLHSLQGHSPAFSYFAPCDSGRLVVFDPETRERFELASGGQPPVWLGPALDGGRLALYQSELQELPPPTSASIFAASPGSWNRATHAAPSPVPYTSGTLWAERLGSGQPLRGPERALFPSLSWRDTARVRVLADFDGDVGRLVEWDLDSGEILEIARGVVDFGQDWALADFDGTAGDLLQVSASLTTRVLAHGVSGRPREPRFANGCLTCLDSLAEAEAVHAALLSDYDGSTGTLLLLSRPARASNPESEVVAHAVPKDGYQMLYGGDAIVYIDEYSADAQSGRLEARFLKTADTFSVDGVASFYEVGWPDPGLLYAIPEGPSAGVWYARLR